MTFRLNKAFGVFSALSNKNQNSKLKYHLKQHINAINEDIYYEIPVIRYKNVPFDLFMYDYIKVECDNIFKDCLIQKRTICD
jgi:hypothetical protein